MIQGSPDSEKNEYGAHMMLHGKMEGGLIGRIEYAEFRLSYGKLLLILDLLDNQKL